MECHTNNSLKKSQEAIHPHFCIAVVIVRVKSWAQWNTSLFKKHKASESFKAFVLKASSKRSELLIHNCRANANFGNITQSPFSPVDGQSHKLVSATSLWCFIALVSCNYLKRKTQKKKLCLIQSGWPFFVTLISVKKILYIILHNNIIRYFHFLFTVNFN